MRVRVPCICAVLLCVAAHPAEPPYYLVDNFTAPLPSSDTIECSTDATAKKIETGLGAARLNYRLDPARPQANLELPRFLRVVPAPGVLKLWIKGDGSGNELEVMLMGTDDTENANGVKEYRGALFQLPKIKLDFSDWRECELDATKLPATMKNNQGAETPLKSWLYRLNIYGLKDRSGKPDPQMKTSGSIYLDDLRLFPVSAPPGATLQVNLLGPPVREFDPHIAIAVDARSFSATPAKARAHFLMTDRNNNRMVERDLALELSPGQQGKEVRLELDPQALESFLPPFKIAGDLLSTDLPDLDTKFELMLVMGNARMLVEDFSNVFGRWFTTGFEDPAIRPNEGGDNRFRAWIWGESQRGSLLEQTTATISRVELKTNADAQNPPGRFAMQVDFTGDAIVYAGHDRYLPGNAYRFGVWVRGDGSGAKVHAQFQDYTNGADFWNGNFGSRDMSGWKRISDGERYVCTLDFNGWRYFEVELPGKGLGANPASGSTWDVDYPLELTDFRIEAGAKKAGSVQFGPTFVQTQTAAASMLSLHVGYDDPEQSFAAGRNAWVTVQNGCRWSARKVKTVWSLVDRAGNTLANGQQELELPSGELRGFPIELSKSAAEAVNHDGPFKLDVTTSDISDASISTTTQMILTKPDSMAYLAGFEDERNLQSLSLSVSRFPPQKPTGLSVVTDSGCVPSSARISADQAHSGARSLMMPWKKDEGLSYVAIDKMPGLPTEVSMWVYGDASGALLFPLAATIKAVNHGNRWAQSNIFPMRSEQGALQNAVAVDWTGWREVKFRLPQVSGAWVQEGSIAPFVPTYPMGLHLGLDARNVANESGAIYIDDIQLATHLEPSQRLSLTLNREGDSDVFASGKISITVANSDLSSAHKASLTGGLYDWRGRRVAGEDTPLELKPGERRQIVMGDGLRAGSYLLRLQLKDEKNVLATLEEDILSGDLAALIGPDWKTALDDPWKLRAPVHERFAYVNEDWDWVEYFPANTQLDTLRGRAHEVREKGAEPYALLGFATYWAAGEGFDLMQSGSFLRRRRDNGNGVDTFMLPQRIDDWDNYICEVMRGAGKDVAGWMLWENPDESSGQLKVDPKKFNELLLSADKWRSVYCPKTPLIIGEMKRGTAAGYLQKLAELHALEHLGGVQVRVDPGLQTPEDSEILSFVRELRNTLKTPDGSNKIIMLSDLDWSVERNPAGISVFDQAAYLSRAALLLNLEGVRPQLMMNNEDSERFGGGLIYRRKVEAPPINEKLRTYSIKPAWWAIANTQRRLDQMKPVAQVEVADTIAGRTQCILYQRADGNATVALWRNNDDGEVTFAATGLEVESAEDILATPVAAQDGWYSIGKVPVMFVLKSSTEKTAASLELLRVRDGSKSAWAQSPLAHFTPGSGTQENYAYGNGKISSQTCAGLNGPDEVCRAVQIEAGGAEKLSVKIPPGAGLVLRKRFILDAQGQEAEIVLNGHSLGKWNLHKSDAQFGNGLKEAIFIVPAEALAGAAEAVIEARYTSAANTVDWTVFEYRGGDFPLTAWMPIHALHKAGHMRVGRSFAGYPLKIGATDYANGLGVFATSIMEYPLNKQFSRFTASIGVDAVTQGQGSATFVIFADEKELKTQTLSGLDAAVTIDVDVKGVDRLRLMVKEAGGQNYRGVADWCDPVLHR